MSEVEEFKQEPILDIPAVDDTEESIPSSDDPIERQIEGYRNSENFRDRLEGVDWSNPDREALLSEIGHKVNKISLDYLSIVEMALLKVEQMLVNKDPNFIGFAHNMVNDASIRDLIETIRIKRFGAIDGYVNSFSPEVQLLISTVMVLYNTYMHNVTTDFPDDFSDDDDDVPYVTEEEARESAVKLEKEVHFMEPS
jgi:hypothetical protein